MHVITIVTSAALALTLGSLSSAAGSSRANPWRVEKVERDCVPFNGTYGYYGNPWCDTGSYRREDIEFRERQARLRRLKAQR